MLGGSPAEAVTYIRPQRDLHGACAGALLRVRKVHICS